MSRMFLCIAFKDNLWPPILIVHPKKKIKHYLYTVIYFFPNQYDLLLWNTRYCKECFFFFFCLYDEHQWGPMLFGPQHTSKYLLCSVQIWIDIRVSNCPFNLQLQINLKSNPSCNDAKESSFLVPTAAHHSPKSLCSWSWGSLYLYRSYPVSPCISSIDPAESV